MSDRSRCFHGSPVLLLISGLLSCAVFGSTFQFDNQRTGRVSSRVVDQPVLLWAFETGGSVEAAPVVGSDGTIYTASAAGNLYALDPQGKVKWTFQGRESFFATPTLGADGRVYCADLSGTYYALDASSGEPIWLYEIDSPGDRRILTSPLVSDSGDSFIAAWDNWLYAFDSEGTLKWRFGLDGLPTASAAADDSGHIYVAGQSQPNHNVVAIYELAADTGFISWQFTEDLWMDRNRVTSSPTLDLQRDRLYMGISRSEDGLLLALDKSTGDLAFRVVFPKGVLGSPAIGSDGTIFVGCLDGRLYAVDPENGSVVWTFRVDGDYIFSSPAVDASGTVFFGDSEGILYAIGPEGAEKWRYRTRANITSAVAIDSQGRLYATSFDGHLYALGSPEVFYFPDIGDGLWEQLEIVTRLELLNRGPDSEVEISFLDPGGSVMPTALGEPGGESPYRIVLPRGGARTLETRAGVPLRGGYVRVSAGPGVSGSAVIQFAQDGVILCEAGVPATSGMRDFTVFLDTAETDRKTGLALVNISGRTANLTLRLYDQKFRFLATRTLSGLKPGSQFVGYASDLFTEVDFGSLEGGILTVQSDQLVAPVTLQQVYDTSKPFPEKVPVLTTFPVLSGRPDDSSQNGEAESVVYFPQVGHGWHQSLGINSTIALANTGADTSAELEFFNSIGMPLDVSWTLLGSGSRFDLDMPSGSSIRAQTFGEGLPEVGYARLITSGSVGGTVVFTGLEDDTILYQAGVAAASPLSDFSLLVKWKRKARNTGLAIVNPGPDVANVVFRLYDSGFHLVGESKGEDVFGRKLAPGHHVAFYVTQAFPAIRLEEEWTGVLTVASDIPLAAVTLSEGDDPGLGFPADVYRLTTYPVVPGRPEP